jgi:CDP-glycerol glycerophosphotransferase (TagB/SpsB family)
MIFIPYDIEEYREYRGFLFDYENHSPGSKVESQQDFVNALRTSLEKPEHDALQRAEIFAIFHKFKSGGSCQRIYDQIKSIN